ncbi:MAG: hypothetical protein ACREFY_12045 [Acetobacteraceae bacterium]
MAFDPTDKLVIVANDAALPVPLLSMINAMSHAVVSRIVLGGTSGLPDATGGIEQSVWMPSNDGLYTSISQIGANGPGGVAKIDPTTGTVVHVYNLADFGISACVPAGQMKGAGQLPIGYGTAGSWMVLFDPTANGSNGAMVSSFDRIGGSDEVAFNANDNLYS